MPTSLCAEGGLKKDCNWFLFENLLYFWQVFIGLGFPYEGPAPLEAISQACVFVNPKVWFS